jgi:hypothetical protein
VKRRRAPLPLPLSMIMIMIISAKAYQAKRQDIGMYWHVLALTSNKWACAADGDPHRLRVYTVELIDNLDTRHPGAMRCGAMRCDAMLKREFIDDDDDDDDETRREERENGDRLF